MAVTVYLFAKAKPENIDDLKTLLQKYLPGTRAFEGCINIEIYEASSGDGEFIFYENWESVENYEAYLAMRTEQGVMDEIGALLAGPPEIKYFDHVAV